MEFPNSNQTSTPTISIHLAPFATMHAIWCWLCSVSLMLSVSFAFGYNPICKCNFNVVSNFLPRPSLYTTVLQSVYHAAWFPKNILRLHHKIYCLRSNIICGLALSINQGIKVLFHHIPGETGVAQQLGLQCSSLTEAPAVVAQSHHALD